MKPSDLHPLPAQDDEEEGYSPSMLDIATWLGEGKARILTVTVAAAIVSVATAFLWPVSYTAHAAMLAPNSQQQSAMSSTLAALAATGALGPTFGGKQPDELYVSLLQSDSVLRELDTQFKLRERHDWPNFETLRRKISKYIHVASDKKSGVISVDVDDRDPKFAADVANAHAVEVTKLLGRLAVSEAKQRRIFFDQQLKDTKENLIKAEQNLRVVQETSGVIVLDKQAEALIGGAAEIRARIAEREVQLKVLRVSATDQNPDVMRLTSELRALRGELARMESTTGGNAGSAVDMPVGRIPEAALDYIRARRELKLQETLLESMVKQLEIAKLDEAKEGQAPQIVDIASPPDYKSKPSRALIIAGGTLGGLLLASAWVAWRRYSAVLRQVDPEREMAWLAFTRAWRFKR
jgi:capsule polysaccharide export protein KpsE/RkpR